MGLLTREQLLKKDELKREKVILDEQKDEFVYVRQMTAKEKNTWELAQLKKTGTGKNMTYDISLDDYRAKLAVITICDENGVLLFSEKDYAELSKNISALKLEKIVNAAQRLNGISDEDKDEMVKN